MTPKEKYDEIFRQTFLLTNEEVLSDKDVLNTESWNSVEHMTFICAMEDAFGISIADDEIMSCTSYLAGMELLRKHGVNL